MLGRNQGGFSTKLHLRAEGGGKPMTFVLTGGERHEQLALPALLDRGAVKRPGRGRPRIRPKRLAGDEGYASTKARAEVRRRGITPVIPTKATERCSPHFERPAYRQRDKVERLVNRLKRHRAIATRYEKLAAHDEALVLIGCILLWL